jgi:hypothetical protein
LTTDLDSAKEQLAYREVVLTFTRRLTEEVLRRDADARITRRGVRRCAEVGDSRGLPIPEEASGSGPMP